MLDPHLPSFASSLFFWAASGMVTRTFDFSSDRER